MNNVTDQINSIFGQVDFTQALFYSVPGGLRFELAEGGTHIHQFTKALSKANEICSYLFPEKSDIAVRLQFWCHARLFSVRPLIRELSNAGIVLNRQAEFSIRDIPDDDDAATNPRHLVTIDFTVHRDYLLNLLWCAVVSDFGDIRPHPLCAVYLINLREQLLIHPYDDRGMDIVGPNHNKLAALYDRFNSYLLDYDRNKMDTTFKNGTSL